MQRKLRIASWMIVSAAVSAAAISCRTADQIEGALGDGKVCVNIVGVYQGSASPGMTVRVETDREVFTEDGSAGVEIGGAPAKIIAIIDGTSVDVIVPLLEPGVAAVRIVAADLRTCEPGRLNVLPVRARTVLFSYMDGQLELRESQPSSGAPRGAADEGGRRLQYEVFNGLGRLVFRGVVNHPAGGRHEVFNHHGEGGQYMHQLPAVQAESLIQIGIPNVPGGAMIRFYDVPEGVDADTAEGRRLRTLVDEFQLEN